MLTDNKNWAIAELRALFTRKGGALAETGAVSWMFDKLGLIRVTGQNPSEDSLLELLLTFDVKDIYQEDRTFVITCDVKSIDDIKHALTTSGYAVESADVEWVPKNTVPIAQEAEDKAYEFLGLH